MLPASAGCPLPGYDNVKKPADLLNIASMYKWRRACCAGRRGAGAQQAQQAEHALEPAPRRTPRDARAHTCALLLLPPAKQALLQAQELLSHAGASGRGLEGGCQRLPGCRSWPGQASTAPPCPCPCTPACGAGQRGGAQHTALLPAPSTHRTAVMQAIMDFVGKSFQYGGYVEMDMIGGKVGNRRRHYHQMHHPDAALPVCMSLPTSPLPASQRRLALRARSAGAPTFSHPTRLPRERTSSPQCAPQCSNSGGLTRPPALHRSRPWPQCLPTPPASFTAPRCSPSRLAADGPWPAGGMHSMWAGRQTPSQCVGWQEDASYAGMCPHVPSECTLPLMPSAL